MCKPEGTRPTTQDFHDALKDDDLPLTLDLLAASYQHLIERKQAGPAKDEAARAELYEAERKKRAFAMDSYERRMRVIFGMPDATVGDCLEKIRLRQAAYIVDQVILPTDPHWRNPQDVDYCSDSYLFDYCQRERHRLLPDEKLTDQYYNIPSEFSL